MKGIETAIAQMGSKVFAHTAQRMFFDAMRMGYVNDDAKAKATIACLPGSHRIVHVDGPWMVIDVYHTTSLSDRSYGTTHLSYEGTPVWMMHYEGEYPKGAIPTLKRALAKNYLDGVWHGGRGPAVFDDGDLSYENNVKDGSIFAGKSSGEEFIVRRKGGLVGFHSYSSLYLIKC